MAKKVVLLHFVMVNIKKKSRISTKIDSSTSLGRGLRSWGQLGFGGKLWRCIWVFIVSLWAFSLFQVLFCWVFFPPITPLMVQRFAQQIKDPDRKVCFKRDYVDIDNISNNLITAVVHSEDGLFLYHHGFDVKQMKLSYLENKKGRRVRGGSTISMQTAKNAFLPHNRTLLRKIVEAYYTILIEFVWDKERIMEVYLNIIEFGDGIYGCEAAAQHYFGHSCQNLSRREAAKLAATLPGPLSFNPDNPNRRYNRHVELLVGRFSRWGMVDLCVPSEKLNPKYLNRENLFQFAWWLVFDGEKM